MTATTMRAARTTLFGLLVERSGKSVRDVARESTLSIPTILNLCRPGDSIFQARTLKLAAEWLSAQFECTITPDRARHAATRVLEPEEIGSAAARFLERRGRA